MEHMQYFDGQKIERKLDNERALFIKIATVGAQPSKVSAEWSITGGRSGIAFGGFQDRKDFEFQAAARAAVENAIAQAKAV